MSTIFSRIISGEIPCHKISEDDKHLAFLDVSPICIGHTLVIPKKAVDYIFDLPDSELADMHVFAKRVAIGIKKAIACKKVGVAVIGLEVPHAHIHLVPMNNVGDLNFTAERVNLSQEEFSHIAAQIASELNGQ